MHRLETSSPVFCPDECFETSLPALLSHERISEPFKRVKKNRVIEPNLINLKSSPYHALALTHLMFY